MTAFLRDNLGKVYRMPELISWQLLYTDGKDGTDAFEICFPYIDGIGNVLDGVCGFFAEHDAERAFTGIVDEYRIDFAAKGSIVTVSGRGMGGVLLDNACRARQYVTAGLDDILAAYVFPYGISVAEKKAMSPLTGYSVSSGSSCMAALTVFTQYAGNVTPRFSKTGSLILNDTGNRILTFSPDAGTEISVSGIRHDVISSVTVIRSDGAERVVENKEFIKDGGRTEKVINVPKSTGYDAMLYAGQYKIDRSMLKRKTVTVKTNRLFCAEPCDIVLIQKGEFKGKYDVSSVICYGDSSGHGSRIVLTKRKEM